MTSVVVPNSLLDAINELLEAEYLKHPAAREHHQKFFAIILDHFSRHVELPEIELGRASVH